MWVKIDDQFAQHPKVVALGSRAPLSIWIWLQGVCYAARHRTDGFVEAEWPKQVGGFTDISWVYHRAEGLFANALDEAEILEAALDGLLEQGLWEDAASPCGSCVSLRTDKHALAVRGAGYLIHDYLRYNPSRAELVKAQEEGRAAAKKRWEKPKLLGSPNG